MLPLLCHQTVSIFIVVGIEIYVQKSASINCDVLVSERISKLITRVYSALSLIGILQILDVSGHFSAFDSYCLCHINRPHVC